MLYKLPPETPGYSAKASLLRRDRLVEDVFYVYLAALPFKLLAYLRVCCCSEEEAEVLTACATRANTGAVKVTAVISRSNEERTLRLCCDLLERVLEVVPRASQQEEQDQTENSPPQPRFCTYNFSSSIEEDRVNLALVQQEILRRSKPGEEVGSRVQASGESLPGVDQPVCEMNIQLLVQYQWIFYYRITKKNIAVEMIKKLRCLQSFVQSGVLPVAPLCVAAGDVHVHADVPVPPSAVSGNKLVTLVELLTAMSGAPPPTCTPAVEGSVSGTAASSKTDKFHIADYDSSIGDSNTLLNDYLKSLLLTCNC